MSRSDTVKCFQGNLDGSRGGLVVAANQKTAAAIAGASLSDFRQFWSSHAPWPALDLKINTLYTRPINSEGEWAEGKCEIKLR